jgi:hypothetical protein
MEAHVSEKPYPAWRAGSPSVNPDYLRSLWLESSRLPYSERFPLPSLVRPHAINISMRPCMLA